MRCGGSALIPNLGNRFVVREKDYALAGPVVAPCCCRSVDSEEFLEIDIPFITTQIPSALNPVGFVDGAKTFSRRIQSWMSEFLMDLDWGMKDEEFQDGNQSDHHWISFLASTLKLI